MSGGFSNVFEGLSCPKCGGKDAIKIMLSDLSMRCLDCEEDIDREDIERMLATWQRLLSWLAIAKDIGETRSSFGRGIAEIDSEVS